MTIKTDRRGFLKLSGGAITASMLPFLKSIPASAASGDVAVAVMGQTINSLDLHRTGTNRPSYQIAVNCYDRLVSFGTKTTPNGGLFYDYSVIEPELAESWGISPDGLTMTFKLKQNAVFQDPRDCSESGAQGMTKHASNAVTLAAEPAAVSFDPARTALIIIDMQRDFLEPGGFGETPGNDVSLLQAAVEPCASTLAAARQAGMMVIHTREGTART